jgi:hypothetical protein
VVELNPRSRGLAGTGLWLLELCFPVLHLRFHQDLHMHQQCTDGWRMGSEVLRGEGTVFSAKPQVYTTKMLVLVSVVLWLQYLMVAILGC